MAGEKYFAPVPLRAMADDLSGLQMRVLACVASHDRRSMLRGGKGCCASNDRMSRLVGCSFARLCSTLSELVVDGYLQKEKLGRHTIYRVVYSEADTLLFEHLSRDEKGCRSAKRGPVIGCRADPKTPGNPPKTPPQEITSKGGRDFDESSEGDSGEPARLTARGAVDSKIGNRPGAYLATLERAFRQERDSMTDGEWRFQVDAIERIIEDAENSPNEIAWAVRLADEIETWLDAAAPPPPLQAGAAR